MEVAIILFGFLAGLVATGVMSIIEVIAWRKWGVFGVLEWHESQNIAARISSYKSLRLGLPIHFFNGGLIGIPFILMSPYLSSATLKPMWGILYALLIWLLTLAPVHGFITGVPLRKHRLGIWPIIVSIFGHGVFGFVLGLIT